MKSSKAPNVAGIDQSARRTVYSICGMCAVRCPIQVEVENGRVVWIQGNPHDKAMETSLCAKGSAGLALEYDDERPQQPLIRTGPRGSGQWREAGWEEALDYVAGKVKRSHQRIWRAGGGPLGPGRTLYRSDQEFFQGPGITQLFRPRLHLREKCPPCRQKRLWSMAERV